MVKTGTAKRNFTGIIKSRIKQPSTWLGIASLTLALFTGQPVDPAVLSQIAAGLGLMQIDA